MGLLNLALPNASADLVAVFDENFNQVFSEARPIKATYNRSSKVMEHPLETGSVIADHRIILPVDVELSMVIQSIDYRSVYGQIENFYLNGTILSVQGKSKTFTNLVISDMPHDEDPSMFTTIAVALKLREAQFVEPQYGKLPPRKVKNKAHSDTTDRGQIQGTATNNDNASILYGWWK